MRKIKTPKIKNKENSKVKEPIINDNSPALSFKYIVNNQNYNLDSKNANKDLKSKLLMSLHKYSKQNWTNFIGDKRHTGVETVGLSDLRNCRVNLPNEQFYNEVKDVVIFRVSNNSARIIGRRINNICYILWLDWNLSSYDHGS